MTRRRVEPIDFHPLEESAPYGRHADVRPEELVGGASDDVCSQGITVYGDVRGGVHSVDGDKGASFVGLGGDSCHVVDGTDCVGGEADGDQPRTVVNVLFHVVLVQGKVLGVHPYPAHLRPLLGGGDEPRIYVGAVVELGNDDLRAFVPLAGEGAGGGEGEGGHVGPKGYLVGRSAKEVRSRPASVGQDLLGLRARREDAMEVGAATLHITRDGLDGLLRHLRTPWPVEVHYTLPVVCPAERRKLFANGFHVELTLHKSSFFNHPFVKDWD